MLVEVIKAYVPYLGEKGTQRDIPSNEARVHILLGNVIAVTSPEEEAPVPRKKRAYRRRDLRAETGE